jgi:hypothetical protein
MPSNEIRFFLCTGECVPREDLCDYPKSHIIGHVQQLEFEGKEVTALARWDVSVPADTVAPLKPAIDCFIIGDARRIKCRHPGCENHQRWEIAKAAFMRLMYRYRKEVRSSNV